MEMKLSSQLTLKKQMMRLPYIPRGALSVPPTSDRATSLEVVEEFEKWPGGHVGRLIGRRTGSVTEKA